MKQPTLADAINAALAIAQRENPRARIILHQLAAALNNPARLSALARLCANTSAVQVQIGEVNAAETGNDWPTGKHWSA
jgi:hypothetical protein